MEQMTAEKLYLMYLGLIAFDFLTGILRAGKEGRLRSRTCRDGIFSTVGELCLLAIGLATCKFLPEIYRVVSTLTLGFMIKELLSIFENLAGLGVWLPKFLVNALEVAVDQIDKGEKPSNKNSKDKKKEK